MKKWLSYLIMLCLVLNLTTGFTVTASAEGVETFTDDAAVYGEEDVYDEEDVYGENDVYDEEPVEIFEGDAEDDTDTVNDPAEPDGFTDDAVSGEAGDDDTDITGLFEDGAKDDMFASSGEAEEITTPLTFTARLAGSTVSFAWKTADKVEYSTDGGTTWKDYNANDVVTLAKKGDTVSFRGENVTTSTDYHFSITGRVAASGDVTSLTNGKGGDVDLTANCYVSMFQDCSGLEVAPELPSTTLADACYLYMFYGCSGLEVAPELPAETLAVQCYAGMFACCSALETAPKLPAENLAFYCYLSMFTYCSALETAPELPAENLKELCYAGMFKGCSGLTDAPELPSESLAMGCYMEMFSGCSGLTEAPELPATTLERDCYNCMFHECTGLKVAPSLPATTLAASCYRYMFYGCSGLEAAPELPATSLAEGCYREMFQDCSGLTDAPKLSATALAEGCYYRMFSGCSGLTEAPELPATTLERECYNSMFRDCTGLKVAPELPATSLAASCYYYMFSGCTSLEIKNTEKNMEYSIPWGIPEGVTIKDTYIETIFENCPNVDLGSGSKVPEIGATYYQKNPNYQDDLDAISEVSGKIGEIGTVTYTPECKAKIDAARVAYDALTENQKEWFKAETLEILTNAETLYAQLKEEADTAAVQPVLEKINAIGTVTYTSECKAKIDEARTAYDALTKDQQALIPENLLKILTDAEARYDQLKAEAEKEAADAAAAQSVLNKINAIGTVTYTSASKAKIDAARTAYNALTKDQKTRITAQQLKKLTDAEARYAQLKADAAAAQSVLNKINAIGTVTYTSASKAKIDAARTAYNALTNDQKARITAQQLKKLTDAEARYAKLKEQNQRAKNTLKMNAKLKATQTGSQINITWGKADGVDGYKVYAATCHKSFMEKYAVKVKGKDKTSLTLKKVNGKAIDLKKSYQIYVQAYKIVDGKTVTMGTTIKAHVVGRKNTTYSNVKSISLNKTSYTLKKGKTAKIQGKTILENKNKKQLTDAHAKTFRFRTSNENVATVTSSGTIKAVGKGTCTIYVYAVNGCAKSVKVTVK